MSICLAALFFFAPNNARAQDVAADSTPATDTSSVGNGTILPLPFVFHTPETGTAFGITVSIIYRPRNAGPELRPSLAQPVVLYTTKKQLILSVENETYLADNDIRLYGTVAFKRFPTIFWGVGNDSPDEAEEDYTPRLYSGLFEAQRQLRPGIYAGVTLQLARRSLLAVEPGRLLDSGIVPGADDATVTGIGVIGTYDTRDYIIFPRAGAYVELRAGLSDHLIGSDYDFASYRVDLRGYRPLWSGAVLALRGTSLMVGGTAPFDWLPLLGGETLLRGYFPGRYRDKNLVAAQLEVRTPVWRRIGIVGFFEVGQVAGALSQFAIDRLKSSYGGGLRFLFDAREGLNLRLDWGFAPGSSGFYLGIGEVF